MTITNPDWVPPIESTFDTGKAIRSEQGLMLAGNPIAMAQGKPGAPRVEGLAQKVFPVVSGATAQTQVFTGLGDYYGIEFEAYFGGDGSAGFNMQFAYSTDGGSTWSSNQNIGSISSGDIQGFAHGTFDFATGNLRSIASASFGGSEATLTATSVSMAGASLQIDAIRIQGSGATTRVIALIKPNGGTA